MTTTDEELFQELLDTFAVEAAEHIQTLNQALLRLERTTDEHEHTELLQEAFRAAHSLKGSARVINNSEIVDLAHGMENILQRARKNEISLAPNICDGLYAVVDAINQLLERKPVALEPIYSWLKTFGDATASAESEASAFAEPQTESAQPEHHLENAAALGDETIRVAVTKLDNLMVQSGELLISKISAEQQVSDIQAISRQLNLWLRSWREFRTLLPKTTSGNGKEQQLVDLATRHEERLQKILHDTTNLQQSMNRDTLRLGMVAARVQDEVRRVRMVPFQILSLSLERAVRDAARIEGKTAAPLTIEGSETELDKKILESLKDALLHLLRNAVSHGIELPEARAAAGKPSEGKVSISVAQRGSEVRIVITDDGRGFDLDALRARLSDPEAAEKTTADDLISLAFEPGISTADHVSTIAGRGVGLDVVRRCIESLQGRIEVDSLAGRGSTIRLIVPVSLAMTRGLLVQASKQRFMLPLHSVEKILEAKDTYSVKGQSLITLDGKPYPLVPLAAVLGLPVGKDSALAVVIRIAEQRIVLLVEDVLTEQELAVKPLSKLLKQVSNVTGAALLGDGQPVVVLNTADLLRSAHQLRNMLIPASSNGHSPNGHSPNGQVSADDTSNTLRILIVDDSITTRTLEKNILQAAGYQVTTATDGTMALRQLQEKEFDLVVSDIQMPNMDGIALTRYLRDSMEYTNLPIILVTSLESLEDRENGLRAGANAYIVKRGFDQAELLSTIHQLV